VEELGDGRKRLTPPLTGEDVRALHAGDVALVSGTVYAARDAAHKRFLSLLDEGEPLPFDPRGAVVYYVGPTPERPGKVVGAAGPSTAGRMDAYTPRLLELGLKGIIGKGGRGPGMAEEFRRHTAVYLAALGGGGALGARHILAQRVIAFEDLGPEAVREMEMDDFPAWVINDAGGRDFYAESRRPWRRDDRLPEELRGGA
jgi:fumarate hydratase subunit beta